MRTWFKGFIVILLLASALMFILSSELFSLKSIYVTGNKTITKNDIINLSQLQYGKNLFKVNKKKIVKSIFKNPKIKAVRIKRILPSSVSIDIIEREAIAIIPYLGSYLNIDDEALIIAVTGLSKETNIPIIEGFEFNDFKIGEMIKIDNKEQLDITMDILIALKDIDLSESIDLINVEDINNVKLITKEGINIIICNNDLLYKMQMAKSIIEDLLKNEKKGIIDMRHDGNPIFKESE
ncbi:MAG: FtsQ-type POTRA domain-containing protein [Firmicutes bacterium]|nr:FtsQ-type POTRA domain-containing protein [Bacillota bacterium]